MAPYDSHFFEKKDYTVFSDGYRDLSDDEIYRDMSDDEKFYKLYWYVLELEERIEQLENNS